MTYNFTALQGNQTGLGDFVVVANDATGGFMVGGILVAIFIIQIVVIATYSKDRNPIIGVVMSAWLCFIYSVFLSIMQVLNPSFMLAFLLVAALGTFLYYAGNP